MECVSTHPASGGDHQKRNTMATRSILVIEDDQDIAQLVQLHLRDLGFEVETASEGAGGLGKALSGSFDLVILDLTLPGVDGLEICRRVRATSGNTLLLMLTARSTELDRVLGLEMGADDYLVKPFSIRELLARVKALFRRAEQSFALASSTSDAGAVSNPLPECSTERDVAGERLICAGDLVIERAKRRVTLAGQGVGLTAKEFDLLVQFACHPGRVYTRSDLLDLLWGQSYEGYEHTVNSHINRLRTKIEADPSRPRYLLTVWGVGYKFTDGAAAGRHLLAAGESHQPQAALARLLDEVPVGGHPGRHRVLGLHDEAATGRLELPAPALLLEHLPAPGRHRGLVERAVALLVPEHVVGDADHHVALRAGRRGARGEELLEGVLGEPGLAAHVLEHLEVVVERHAHHVALVAQVGRAREQHGARAEHQHQRADEPPRERAAVPKESASSCHRPASRE